MTHWHLSHWIGLAALFLARAGFGLDAAQSAEVYVAAVKEINEAHARNPGSATESELARKLPKAAAKALAALLQAEATPEVVEALVSVAGAALDLDRVDDFDLVHRRLEETAPEAAATIGVALSRPRVLYRGLGGLNDAYLLHFAEIFDLILTAYDETFAFKEWSKVKGKKLRVRIHLETTITRPPHFAPQFPFHSEIDFPVVDAEKFSSPTADGKFLFYGLCHELGHVIAMWGDRDTEEDHHAWAHYAGLVIVDHLSAMDPKPAQLAECRDARWRSLAIERKTLTEAAARPALADRNGVMALLLELHEIVGAAGIGRAMNALNESESAQRINRVRYYRIADFMQALLKAAKSKPERAAIESLMKGL